MTLKNGDVYEGNFKEGKRSGYGILTQGNEMRCYKGEWLNDVKHGYGEIQWNDGSKFKG